MNSITSAKIASINSAKIAKQIPSRFTYSSRSIEDRQNIFLPWQQEQDLLLDRSPRLRRLAALISDVRAIEQLLHNSIPEDKQSRR
jgi:hypothetical protein